MASPKLTEVFLVRESYLTYRPAPVGDVHKSRVMKGGRGRTLQIPAKLYAQLGIVEPRHPEPTPKIEIAQLDDQAMELRPPGAEGLDPSWHPQFKNNLLIGSRGMAVLCSIPRSLAVAFGLFTDETWVAEFRLVSRPSGPALIVSFSELVDPAYRTTP